MGSDTPGKIVASTFEPAFAVDEAGRVVAWNEGMSRLLGFGAGDAVNRVCHDIVCGRDIFGNRFCDTDCNLLRMARRREPVRRFQLDLRHADGHRVCSEVISLVFPGDEPATFTLVHLLRPADGDGGPGAGAAIPPVGGSVSGPGDARTTEPLTDREKEILQRLASGAGTQEIADSLYISAATVRSHVQNLLRKLNVHSKLEAVALAFRRGLV